MPARLRELAEETWQALNKLADPGGDTPDVHELLDELRAGYAELYDEAEAIARPPRWPRRTGGEGGRPTARVAAGVGRGPRACARLLGR